MLFVLLSNQAKTNTERRRKYMHKASTKGFWKCLAACTAVCGAGCLACLLDGPIFIADTATGGAALASGSSAGLK